MNPYAHKGMSTWMEQEHDRKSWKQSIERRKTLLQKLRAHGIRVEHGHERKIAELERMLKEVEG